jgi:hypothetical protein
LISWSSLTQKNTCHSSPKPRIKMDMFINEGGQDNQLEQL